MTSKKYLENCNMKELKSIGLLTQTDLAKYLKVSFRTTNRLVNENKNFCYPICIRKKKYYHEKLVDKYCEKFPATREQIKAQQQKNKIKNAESSLNEILTEELNR